MQIPFTLEKFPVPSRRREATEHPDGSVDAAALEAALFHGGGRGALDGATLGLYATDHSEGFPKLSAVTQAHGPGASA
jgi:hypothetical protein